MPLRIDPAVQTEAEEAALWYERQEAGLAWKFFSAYDAAIDAIERNPESFPMLETTDSPEFRYCILKPYAYRIVFRTCRDEVQVFGLGHIRRDSTFWDRRLGHAHE